MNKLVLILVTIITFVSGLAFRALIVQTGEPAFIDPVDEIGA